MLQVSLSQVQSAVSDEFQWSEFESYDSELDMQMELDLLEAVLEDLF
nr:MAG TPA: hypothetical protein [Caudoviricetes sp.]